ncbi:MAG: hypothetical protein ACEY3M_08600, partial [Wolbachia sp.]
QAILSIVSSLIHISKRIYTLLFSFTLSTLLTLFLNLTRMVMQAVRTGVHESIRGYEEKL